MKGFELEQGEAAMKVGTDGTVLGAYTIEWLLKRHIQPRLILDVGTGTGVIALMLAQKFSSAVFMLSRSIMEQQRLQGAISPTLLSHPGFSLPRGTMA